MLRPWSRQAFAPRSRSCWRGSSARHDEPARQRDDRRRATCAPISKPPASSASCIARSPERANLVTRIKGTGGGPSLLLLGHTDVVLADPAEWDVPPFSGEVRDGEVWGRGALDMKCQVAANAVAIASLAREGFKPSGDLIFVANADEENGVGFGLEWMCEAHPDAVRCGLLRERGRGRPHRARRQRVLPLLVGGEDELAVHDPRPRAFRPRVDAEHRRQRAREGRRPHSADRRVPARAADAAGGRGLPPRRARRGPERRARGRARA